MNSDETKQLAHDRRICVVIPVYNNAGTVAHVVTSAAQYCDDIIVVDDGSTDGTTEALQALSGITLVGYANNRGKGYALQTGFRRAQQMGFAYAITMDADGQHYASDIATLVEANAKHGGALIIGQRRMEGVERSGGSSFANKFSNFWFCVQTLRYLPDTQTGFRLYPLHHLHGLRLLTARYEAELELLVLAAWHGVEIVSVPINVYYPPREERVSHFRPGPDFARISVLNTILCLLAVVYGYPLTIGRWLWRCLLTIYSIFLFLSVTFLVTPFVYIYVLCGKMTEKKRAMLHRVIYYSMRFFTVWHGIPGAKYTHSVGLPKDADMSDTFATSDVIDAFNGKPRIYICNHESHYDLAYLLSFTPKLVFLTKDWVWHNPFYGFLIRHAEFYPVSEGIEKLLPQARSLISRGYSIAVFPEGTRSTDCSIRRFHQGAFYLASQLGLDIQPLLIYGTGKILPKHAHMVKPGRVHVEILPLLTHKELDAIGTPLHQSSRIWHRYQQWYQQLANKMET